MISAFFVNAFLVRPVKNGGRLVFNIKSGMNSNASFASFFSHCFYRVCGVVRAG
jgi:hypothetical protein